MRNACGSAVAWDALRDELDPTEGWSEDSAMDRKTSWCCGSHRGLRDSLRDPGKSWDIPGMGREQRKREPGDVAGCCRTARWGAEG